MKVTGFSFIKNAIIFDYPIVEAISSILPVCDNFIVAVGKSSDKTLNLIESIDKTKIKIVETEWDEDLRNGGEVLSIETNKAFAEISKESNWAFYIQGDEVVHEKYLETIYDGMKRYCDNKDVDGLLFKYKHFYGSYDYIGTSAKWYNNEIRIIKNDGAIYSYLDAQGFRKGDNEKLNVKLIDAYIYHYGWVKDPKVMQKKQENFHKYWHNDKWMESNILKAEEFDYFNIDTLQLFRDTHPKVMTERIKNKNWKFDYDISKNNESIKNRTKSFLKKYLGMDFSYKNYRII